MPKKVVEIIFYGGVKEIGGNKILIRDKGLGKSIFLDFGKSFELSRMYYEFPFNYPESIEELINIDAVPPIQDLYTKSETNFENDPEPTIDAFFISHPHLDHYGHISLLSRKARIFVGQGAKNIIEVGSKLITRKTSPELNYNGLKFETFKTGDEIQIGDMVVKPIHVDHSIPGAYGFIIYTSIGTIAYTGDFRIHGAHKELTEDFIRELEKEEIKVLITEGTHVEFSSGYNEEDVRRKLLEVIDETKELIIADFGKSDYDRFTTFYNISKQVKRSIIVDPKRYAILQGILKIPNIRTKVDLMDPDILVVRDEKKRPTKVEKEILNTIPDEKKISITDISKNGEKYIYSVFFASSRDIKKVSPSRGSVYILSASEPFNEEREISFEKLINWLEFFGVSMYSIHCSGHATPNHLKRLIIHAQPEIVIPVHTLRPILFRNFVNFGDWRIPDSRGSRIVIE
ncbi:MAG: MBL fold metallo-hydrolase [Candidatus Njordarchaeia archaeon]|nr:MBL fold metallo-hydrolase [Candidatus Korarchaeota archaeon]